ncbi:MAG TPA: hypothetical protein VMT53_27960 [Terriglobales bacterium]|nr:hypothetical protein [Terriglobales bacterium]
MAITGTGRAKDPKPFSSNEFHSGALTRAAEVAPKRVGYGLPCANCGTYYAADESACPICKSPERVSAKAAVKTANVTAAECLPDLQQIDEERERFLKEYKAQMFAAHTQIDPAASFGCSLADHHGDAYEPASVCKGCYERVQQRADQVEAALHIDLKEAAQIVHDAVWADPSDPSKTYQNAAQALLTEVRRRAGIDIVLTTLQPYAH